MIKLKLECYDLFEEVEAKAIEGISYKRTIFELMIYNVHYAVYRAKIKEYSHD